MGAFLRTGSDLAVSCLSRWGKVAAQGTKAVEPLLSPPMSVMLHAVPTVSFKFASSPTGLVLLVAVFTVGLEGDLSEVTQLVS